MNVNNINLNNIEQEVNGIIKQIQKGNPNLSETNKIQRAWYKIIDKNIAKHTDAVFIVPKTNCSEVIIYVDNSIWAAELSMRAEVFRIDLNVKLAEMDRDAGLIQTNSKEMFDYSNIEKVKRLKFLVSKRKYNKPVENPRITPLKKDIEKIQPLPLSSKEEEEINKAAEAIKDDTIRAAAIKAAKSHLEWSKALGDKNGEI